MIINSNIETNLLVIIMMRMQSDSQLKSRQFDISHLQLKLTTMYSLLNPLALWLVVLCLLMLFTLTSVSSSNLPRSSIESRLKRFSPSSMLRFISTYRYIKSHLCLEHCLYVSLFSHIIYSHEMC